MYTSIDGRTSVHGVCVVCVCVCVCVCVYRCVCTCVWHDMVPNFKGKTTSTKCVHSPVSSQGLFRDSVPLLVEGPAREGEFMSCVASAHTKL